MTPGSTLLLLLAPASAVAADLLEAAIAYLSASAAVAAAVPGGVHADEAPVGTALPFLVVSEPSGATFNESGSASWEPVSLQLAIYGPKEAARSARRAVVAALQDAPLAFAAGTLLHLRAGARSSAKDPERGPGGVDVWQEVQAFDCVVGHG